MSTIDFVNSLIASYDWMLSDIKAKRDSTGFGSYSGELKKAIEVGELLKKYKDGGLLTQDEMSLVFTTMERVEKYLKGENV